MNIFVAGGSGTIGIPLVRALIGAGHPVTAMTRSTTRQDDLKRMGASVVVADALNREAVVAAINASHPTHVIHQLTALPKSGPRRPGDVEATNRLRIDGTRYLWKRQSMRAPGDSLSARLHCWLHGAPLPRGPEMPLPPQWSPWNSRYLSRRLKDPLKASSFVTVCSMVSRRLPPPQ